LKKPIQYCQNFTLRMGYAARKMERVGFEQFSLSIASPLEGGKE